jgi:hypothetical protein
MSRQLLFYDKVTPLSSQRHAKWCIDGSTQRYQFSSGVNSVPVTAIEIPPAAREYSIVFAGADDAIVPVVILGIEGNENLYVSADGTWNARYVPAFVRRYPFVFTTLDAGKTFTLCIDEAYSGCNEDGNGERLFDDDGKPAAYLNAVLTFLREYQAEHLRTEAFARRMASLGLLEPVQANVALQSGRKLALTDFKVVNRERLKQVGDVALKEMFSTDDLEYVYLHLQSLQTFPGLATRLEQAG